MNDRTDFPYKSCLLLTIEEISAHNEYMYHGDKAKLDVVVLIEDVLKSGTLYNDPKNDTGFRKGARVTFVIDKPELLAPGESVYPQLIGIRTIWGVNWWRIGTGLYHLDNLFEPFSGQKFTSKEIEQLKSKLLK